MARMPMSNAKTGNEKRVPLESSWWGALKEGLSANGLSTLRGNIGQAYSSGGDTAMSPGEVQRRRIAAQELIREKRTNFMQLTPKQREEALEILAQNESVGLTRKEKERNERLTSAPERTQLETFGTNAISGAAKLPIGVIQAAEIVPKALGYNPELGETLEEKRNNFVEMGSDPNKRLAGLTGNAAGETASTLLPGLGIQKGASGISRVLSESPRVQKLLQASTQPGASKALKDIAAVINKIKSPGGSQAETVAKTFKSIAGGAQDFGGGYYEADHMQDAHGNSIAMTERDKVAYALFKSGMGVATKKLDGPKILSKGLGKVPVSSNTRDAIGSSLWGAVNSGGKQLADNIYKKGFIDSSIDVTEGIPSSIEKGLVSGLFSRGESAATKKYGSWLATKNPSPPPPPPPLSSASRTGVSPGARALIRSFTPRISADREHERDIPIVPKYGDEVLSIARKRRSDEWKRPEMSPFQVRKVQNPNSSRLKNLDPMVPRDADGRVSLEEENELGHDISNSGRFNKPSFSTVGKRLDSGFLPQKDLRPMVPRDADGRVSLVGNIPPDSPEVRSQAPKIGYPYKHYQRGLDYYVDRKDSSNTGIVSGRYVRPNSEIERPSVTSEDFLTPRTRNLVLAGPGKLKNR